MRSDLKDVIIDYKVKLIYNNNLFSIKSICQFLKTWDNYSNVDKLKLENLTKRDTIINKNYHYSGTYDDNLIYGEVTRKGVNTILEKINKWANISEKSVFIDIGSGCGKLLLHLSIISNIKTLVGVEIVKERVDYSKFIYDQVLPDKKVFFINKDILDFDLSIANIVFINDVCFDKNLVRDIYNKIPKGCHFMTTFDIGEKSVLKEVFDIDVTWSDDPQKWRYYIK